MYQPCTHHVQFALVADHGRHAVGGQRAGSQGVVGVHDGAVLVVSVGRDGRVEAGPEHPQVDGTYGDTQHDKYSQFSRERGLEGYSGQEVKQV